MTSHTGTETRPRLLREAAVGILRNGRKPDAATPRGGGRLSGRKPLSAGTKMTVPAEEAPANYVPAAAVTRRGQALSGFTGRRARRRLGKLGVKTPGSTWRGHSILPWLEFGRGSWNFWCSGEMRRYQKEHQRRRQRSGPILTLRSESMGSKQD